MLLDSEHIWMQYTRSYRLLALLAAMQQMSHEDRTAIQTGQHYTTECDIVKAT